MKKLLFGLIAAVMLMFSTASPSFADDRDFTIVNATGYPIKFIGVNPPGDNVWNENELDGILPDGGKKRVKFSNADKGCMWHIKVTWADDNTSSIFRGLNLCKIETVTLKYNRKTDEATYTTE